VLKQIWVRRCTVRVLVCKCDAPSSPCPCCVASQVCCELEVSVEPTLSCLYIALVLFAKACYYGRPRCSPGDHGRHSPGVDGAGADIEASSSKHPGAGASQASASPHARSVHRRGAPQFYTAVCSQLWVMLRGDHALSFMFRCSHCCICSASLWNDVVAIFAPPLLFIVFVIGVNRFAVCCPPSHRPRFLGQHRRICSLGGALRTYQANNIEAHVLDGGINLMCVGVLPL